MTRYGWAVQISRKDGTTFLATGGEGTSPAIWFSSKNRKHAVAYKNTLKTFGLKGKVVKVEYTDPVVVGPYR